MAQQLHLSGFMGINKSMGEQGSMKYATHAENIDTRFGKLRAVNGYENYLPFIEAAPVEIPSPGDSYEDFGPIRKLFSMSLRHLPGHNNMVVAATESVVYLWKDGGGDWQYITRIIPEAKNSSMLAFETVVGSGTNKRSVDALLVSSASNGMILSAFTGVDTSTLNEPLIIETHTVDTPAKFGVIERYNERVFGTGSPEDPDRIWYSALYDPENWEQNMDIPEDGAGFFDYPTWDGDKFIALKEFGSNLLAFKRDSLCVISGTNPGEYTIYKAFGADGPIAPDTIAVYRNMVFFLTDKGIGIFDGSTIRNISRDALGYVNFDAEVNRESAKAVIHDGIYTCAVAVDDSQINAIIEYDIERGTYMLRTGLSVTAWANHEDDVHGECTLLVDELHVNDWPNGHRLVCMWDVNKHYGTRPIHSVWQSPWTDMGHKEAVKSGFRVHALIEDWEEEGSEDPKVNFSVETERKIKTKALHAQHVYTDKKKTLVKPVSNKGRQFRWKIESDMPFAIETGLQISVDLDSD